MNIFIVPSWYPSDENPIYGTFVKEQIEMLAKHNPDWNLGVSLWGQGQPSHILWAKDHLLNMAKIIRSRQFYSDRQSNLSHFYHPVVIWTRKLLYGNLKSLIHANAYNLKLFKKHVGKIDIIHAQATYPAALIAQYLSEKFSIPYVVSIRMSPFPFSEFLTKKGKLKSLIAKPLHKASALIATSHSLKVTMEAYGLTNIHVVHNPVDTDFFKPSGYEPKELTILTVGRMEDQKGIDILIEAIILLGDEFKGKVRIGGDGSQNETYQMLANKKGVSDKIDWLGELSREQVRDEMQRCSFYVLPSRHETFGNVLLEAMTCGKPVVATKCGGPEDIVTAEVGLFCKTGNVEDLAEKIGEMVLNFKNYSSFTIIKANQRFSLSTFSTQIEKLYMDAGSNAFDSYNTPPI